MAFSCRRSEKRKSLMEILERSILWTYIFYLEGCDPDCTDSVSRSWPVCIMSFTACSPGRKLDDEKETDESENDAHARSRLYTSLLLVLMALVAVTAATVAWFSIADNTKVKTMSLDIVADTDLRMDLDPHESIGQYVKTLSLQSFGPDTDRGKPLDPVTTSDEQTFTYENGTVFDTSGRH